MWVDPKTNNKRGGSNERRVHDTEGDKAKKKRIRPRGMANQTASGIDAYKEPGIKPFLQACQQKAEDLASTFDFELGAEEKIYATNHYLT